MDRLDVPQLNHAENYRVWRWQTAFQNALRSCLEGSGGRSARCRSHGDGDQELGTSSTGSPSTHSLLAATPASSSAQGTGASQLAGRSRGSEKDPLCKYGFSKNRWCSRLQSQSPRGGTEANGPQHCRTSSSSLSSRSRQRELGTSGGDGGTSKGFELGGCVVTSLNLHVFDRSVVAAGCCGGGGLASVLYARH